MAGIDGLEAGDRYGEQMRALFGAGMHPLATQRLEQLGDADLTDANIETATRLGLPFKVSDIEPGRFRVEVAKRITALNEGRAARRLAGSPCREGQDPDRGGPGVVRGSMAGHQQMLGRWRRRLRNILDRGRRRSPAMI